uniref:Maestro/Maestro-like HEAT-repeats domain-containing protein n=1 Tax=Anas platyrhynchos TaxID=8839 RepID=A0A8B9SG84_ANAPL
MKEPPLEKRNVLKILRVLAEKAQHRSSTIRQLAARALGNAAGSMPVEVRRIFLLVQVLQQSLADTACPEVVAESMLALAELMRVLQAVNLGSAFEDIARATKMFFESYLRYSALRLYSVLASSASSKRSFFAGEVAETWVSLFLHLRDPDFAVASVSALGACSQSPRKLCRDLCFLFPLASGPCLCRTGQTPCCVPWLKMG